MADTIYTDVIGFDNLVYAPITADTEEAYTAGTVAKLMPAGELSKTVTEESATKYYDNKAFFEIKSRGSDELTITGAKIPSDLEALLCGDAVDETTGIAVESGEVSETKYFAIGYRTQYTDGTNKLTWLYKCTIARPSETAKTKDDSTDSNGTELTIKSVDTIHKFNGKTARRGYVDERNGKITSAKFFAAVLTPDKFSEVTV